MDDIYFNCVCGACGCEWNTVAVEDENEDLKPAQANCPQCRSSDLETTEFYYGDGELDGAARFEIVADGD